MIQRFPYLLRFAHSGSVHKLAIAAPEIQKKTNKARKAIKVAFIGMTNAGKSTIINAIMDLPICAASSRAHTTRAVQSVFHIKDDTEVTFLDTPGVVTPKEINKFKFPSSFDVFGSESAKSADVVGVVLDVSCPYTRRSLPFRIKPFMRSLYPEAEAILILNKVDKVKQKWRLLEDANSVIEESKNLGILPFTRVFMISALKKDGVEDVAEYIRSIALEKGVHEKEIFKDKLSNLSIEQVVAQKVRAAALEHVTHEVPYQCRYIVELIKENLTGHLFIGAKIICDKTYQIRRVTGNNNYRLSAIKEDCEIDLGKIFGKPVSLSLAVNLKSNTVAQV